MEASNQPQPLKYNGNENSSGTTLKIVVAVVVLAIIGGIVAWILVDRSNSDSDNTPTTVTAIGPKAVSASDLSAVATQIGHPVYWAGEITGQTMEFTQTTNGNVYVRYLPGGVAVGDKRANFLIVATYPFPGAFKALENVANGKEVKVPGGGIAVVSEPDPKSVHVAFPDVDYQIEVFDPSPAKSLSVATSGDIQPVP